MIDNVHGERRRLPCRDGLRQSTENKPTESSRTRHIAPRCAALRRSYYQRNYQGINGRRWEIPASSFVSAYDHFLVSVGEQPGVDFRSAKPHVLAAEQVRQRMPTTLPRQLINSGRFDLEICGYLFARPEFFLRVRRLRWPVLVPFPHPKRLKVSPTAKSFYSV